MKRALLCILTASSLLLTTCGSSTGVQGTSAAPTGPVTTPAPSASPARALPPAQSGWSYVIGASQALNAGATPSGQVISLDLYDVTARAVSRLRAAGKYVVCYYSAGSSETYRSDAQSLRLQDPALNLGQVLKGEDGVWAGERWLDLRGFGSDVPAGRVIREVMASRLALAKEKGCQAVDPDNIDAWSNDVSRNAPAGTPVHAIGAGDQLAYNRWTAAAAHALGLSVLLKNDLDQVTVLAADYDGAINEECFDFGSDCDLLRPFRDAGKGIYVVEYHGADFVTAERRAQAGAGHLNVILSDLNLTRVDPVASFGTWN